MKVYIKPWKEASECAKEANNFLVDTSDDGTRILGILHISQRAGDWGHIIEATKDGKYYTAEGRYSFSYPACCAEEITPEWLEEHAEVFAKDRYIVDTSYELTDCDYCQHFNIIYKVKDTLNTYFFYVHKFYERGCENPVITDFREIK